MIGSEPPPVTRQPRQRGEVVLSVSDLSLGKADPFGIDLQGINLTVAQGEVVGIAGVSGNGQKELLLCLSGEDSRVPSGSMALRGTSLSGANPKARREMGLHFVPEERLGRGAVPGHSLALNMLLTRSESVTPLPLLPFVGGWIKTQNLNAQASVIIERFRVKANGPAALASSLSGGNLQKFIMGREIDALPKLLIVSQPTWGVDVGAAAQIRSALLALADSGCAVVVVSEELDELFEICGRLHVLANGTLSPSMARLDATVERVGQWMSGLWHDEKAPAQKANHAAA